MCFLPVSDLFLHKTRIAWLFVAHYVGQDIYLMLAIEIDAGEVGLPYQELRDEISTHYSAFAWSCRMSLFI